MKVTDIAALNTETMTPTERKAHYTRLTAIHFNEYGHYGEADTKVVFGALKDMQQRYPDEFSLVIGWLTAEEAQAAGYESLAAALEADYENTPKLGFGKKRQHNWIAEAAKQDAYIKNLLK